MCGQPPPVCPPPPSLSGNGPPPCWDEAMSLITFSLFLFRVFPVPPGIHPEYPDLVLMACSLPAGSTRNVQVVSARRNLGGPETTVRLSPRCLELPPSRESRIHLNIRMKAASYGSQRPRWVLSWPREKFNLHREVNHPSLGNTAWRSEMGLPA